MRDSNINFVDQGTAISGDGDINLKWFGGALTTDDTQVDELFEGDVLAGGLYANIVGVDLSVISGTNTWILGDAGDNPSADDNIQIVLERCKIGASLTAFVEVGSFVDSGMRFEAYNCSSSSTAAEFQFFIQSRGGLVDDATDITRDNSEPFTDSNQKVSMKVDTDANPTVHLPFWFDLPARYAELSNASTDTIRLFLLSSDSGLTNNDVWAEMIYPDGTTKQLGNYISTQHADALNAGTALTANSDAWTGRTSETRYQIDVDTSSDIGADSVPIIRIFVAKPDIIVYFDTSVEVVA